MKKYFRGFLDIFSFTFIQHSKNPGYRRSTIIVALLCLIIPAGIMIGIESFNDEESNTPDIGETEGVYEEYVVDMTPLEKVYLVDLSEDKTAKFDGLKEATSQVFGIDVEVIDKGSDFASVQKETKGKDNSLIVVTEQKGKEYNITTIIPEGSSLSEDVAYNFDLIVMSYADMFTMENNEGIVTEDIDEPTEEELTEEEMEAMETESAKELVSMIVMYLCIMLLYFFVLVYGQGVANSVVMEKSSKLMESMLVAVNPVAIILGKLFAITATGVIQLLSWIGALGLSFAIGMHGVKEINPDTTMAVIEVFEALKEMTEGLFSPANCILAAIMIVAGMLLYCSLAGIGGAMASKAEDLSSANIIFTLALVISFLATLYGGGLDGEAAPIFDWIPFTAVMITPANVLLGNMPLWKTFASLAIIVATTVVSTVIAGKLYKTLVFYRGDVLKPAAIIKILKEKN